MQKFYLLFSIFCLLVIQASAQEKKLEPWQYGHWLSAEEMLQKYQAGKSFQETPPPIGPVRNVAEFDRMQGVLVRYPFGIPIELVKDMAVDVMVTTIVLNSTQQATVTSQYQAAGVNMAHCNFLLAPSDSYWTRDYGPWFESDSSQHIGIMDFPYNRPRPNDDEIPKKVAEMLGIPWFGMNIIHTGGNYMTDGMGISSSTTLVWNENPTQTHDSIATKFLNYLGIDPYLVEPDPNGSYINHIDCWGKYLAPDKILIRKVPPSHPQYAEIEATANFYANTPCSYGYNYRVFRVNTPNDQPYSNSLILNNKVFVPIMNSSWDDSAIAAYQAAMPGYQVIGILGNPSTPWVSTDALHCRGMGIADIGQLYIHHIPLTGNQPAQDNFLLTADLIPCGDSAVYNDSVLVWYQVNSGNYIKVNMVNTSGLHYTGMIPKQPSGSVIHYYLYAADKSGHNATMPFMGPADPFTFTAIYTDITAIPDTLWFRTMADILEGKATRLHNFTTAGINLDSVQQSGGSGWWWVDTLSVTSFPHMMNPGDSEYVHVMLPTPETMADPGYWIDTMNVISELGTHRVILMINSILYTGIPTVSGNEASLLLYNYPNPFNGSTVIHYQLLERSNVKLDVMNTFGTKVATLVNVEQAEGAYNVTFNAGDLPAGIYYFRIVTDKETVTKKMFRIR
ncbi:MAG: T9SS C-terminal target domain-containing protein [Bacteroidetes bacterium]|nr:MAG: T9SS C-terminal target domain-containing protein [Bacteroidota bacterium]